MRSRSQLLGLAVAAWVSGFGGGCAFDDIDLRMPPTGLGPKSDFGVGRQIVIMAPFVDARRDVSRCGMQQNNLNMDTADAHCSAMPIQWIADALAADLRNAGFEVLQQDDPRRPSALVVKGTLIQLFVEPVAGFWTVSMEADVDVLLLAGTETGFLAERRFFVKGVDEVLVSTESGYIEAFGNASAQILSQMVEALKELMRRYPELGRGGSRVRIVLAEAGFR